MVYFKMHVSDIQTEFLWALTSLADYRKYERNTRI